MGKKLIRIVGVIMAMLLFGGANPFRVVPDEVLHIGEAQLATAVHRDEFTATVNPEELEFIEGAIRSVTEEDLAAYEPVVLAEATKEPSQRTARIVHVEPSGENSEEEAPEATEAPAETPEPSETKASEEEATEEEAALEEIAAQPEASVKQARAVTAAETLETDPPAEEEPPAQDAPTPTLAPEATRRIAADTVWQPTPTPTRRPTPTPAPQNVAGEDTSDIVAARATSDPVLGTVEKTWQHKESGLSIRVDQRKIGSSVAYVATVRANVSRMQTYTVAGPGQTGSFRATSTLAKGVDAAIAINGDFYDYKTRRGYGVVIRNGVLYNNKPYGRWGYVIYENGKAEIARDYDLGVEELLMNGAKDVYAFGPALVKDGKFVKPDQENTHPRTAIGRINDDTWVLIVVDGRQSGYSVGMKYQELANLFIALGCDTAYNLDGGGSSTIWLKGYGVLNKPSDGSERGVPDIIYFS